MSLENAENWGQLSIPSDFSPASGTAKAEAVSVRELTLTVTAAAFLRGSLPAPSPSLLLPCLMLAGFLLSLCSSVVSPAPFSLLLSSLPPRCEQMQGVEMLRG